MTISTRTATQADMHRVLELIEAHAAYERSGPVKATAERLGELMIDGDAATCLVAVNAAHDGRVVGYATVSKEFSTWDAAHYLHMDTLFVEEAARRRRIGQQLFNAVVQLAANAGCQQVQWQTPEWNVQAIRFYERAGATSTSKQRFTLDLEQDQASPCAQ